MNIARPQTKTHEGWVKKQGAFYTRLLVPSLILLTVITILPILFLVITSFTSWNLSLPGSLKFIGIDNYLRIFTQDTRFWNSVQVQVKLTLLTVPLQIIIGLGLAIFRLGKDKEPFLIELARGVFIIPMVIPPIVAAMIWKILFTPPVSILNYVVTSFGREQLAWLGHPN